MRQTREPRKTSSKFDCTCAETGKTIERGEECLFDPISKLAYHRTSDMFKNFKKPKNTPPNDPN
jgi:hypothetical protein